MSKIIPLIKGVPVMGSDGALGWSSVTYVEEQDLRILVDTGFYGNRHLVMKALRDHGIQQEDVNLLFLTHLHFDHCQNVDLFPNAQIVLSQAEFDYAVQGQAAAVGDEFIPEYITERLQQRELTLFKEEMALNENIKVVLTPGHTPGSATLLLKENEETLTAVCGDLLKYAWEVYPGTTAPKGTFGGEEQLKSSQHKILKSGVTRIIPGHDRPFRMVNHKIHYESSGEVQFSFYLNRMKAEETHFRITLPD
ncbi:MBL fold metallo-hydrolase [Neobacillus sp. NRS-1170]|uniref:MBL fold metallo-hydrolase n=1 Tax=Neobacillus sp. NRS-1170 TaxID=3233898 RepID=UPI003D2884B3